MLRLTLICAFLIASISAAPMELTNQLSESPRGHPVIDRPLYKRGGRDDQYIDEDGNSAFIPPTRRSLTYYDAEGNAHASETDDGDDNGSGGFYFDDAGNKIPLKRRSVSLTRRLEEGYYIDDNGNIQRLDPGNKTQYVDENGELRDIPPTRRDLTRRQDDIEPFFDEYGNPHYRGEKKAEKPKGRPSHLDDAGNEVFDD